MEGRRERERGGGADILLILGKVGGQWKEGEGEDILLILGRVGRRWKEGEGDRERGKTSF